MLSLLPAVSTDDHRAALGAHLRRLDASSRHRRFGGGVSDAGLDAYARGWNPTGAFALVDASGAWRGVVEILALAEGEAELALSIEAPYRGQGWGGRLLEAAACWGRARGMRRYTLTISTHNPAMAALARHVGALSEGPHASVAHWALGAAV